MGCCGGGKPKPSFSKIVTDLQEAKKLTNIPATPKQGIGPLANLVKAMGSQSNKLLWFKDGVTGLAKCFANSTKYTDEQIKENRDKCRGCEYSTKENGKLTTMSQCMAPDPMRNGAACGCFILCKTQTGTCPKEKWTHLTISASKLPDSGV